MLQVFAAQAFMLLRNILETDGSGCELTCLCEKILCSDGIPMVLDVLPHVLKQHLGFLEPARHLPNHFPCGLRYFFE